MRRIHPRSNSDTVRVSTIRTWAFACITTVIGAAGHTGHESREMWLAIALLLAVVTFAAGRVLAMWSARLSTAFLALGALQLCIHVSLTPPTHTTHAALHHVDAGTLHATSTMVTLHVIAALIGAGLLCAIDKAIARTLANAARGIATALGCTPQRLKTSTRLHTAPSGIDTPATARSVLLAAWRFLRGPPRLALHDLSP